MKKNLVPLLFIAFIVAIAATGIVYGLFVGRLREASTPAVKEQIAVAAHNLSRGAKLGDSDVKLVPWTAADRPKGTYTQVQAVVGQTLMDALQENEPFTSARLASRKSAGELGIPSGMRAVSVRVSEAPGVTGLLRPGHRVDVQYLGTRNNSNDTEVRTLLQNLEVLAINPQQETATRVGMTVVTVLATPADADLLSLADSNNRLRLTLRNPLDEEKFPLQTVSFGSTQRSDTVRATPVRLTTTAAPQLPNPVSPAPPATEQRVALWVRVAGIQSSAATELVGQFVDPPSASLLQVCAMKPGADLDSLMKSLEEKQQFTVLQTSRLNTGTNREVSFQALGHSNGVVKSKDYGMRISFRPTIDRQGQLRLRVQPEVVAPQDGILTTRRIATEVELKSGQTFVVTGLAESAKLLSGLFPRMEDRFASGEMMVFVTPQIIRQPVKVIAGMMP